MKFVYIAAASLLTLPALSHAQNIDQRQANQEARIQQGEKSGALNKNEAERLRQGQKHVQALEDKARADGKVTDEERKQIEQAQNRQNQRLNAQLDDKQRSAATGGTAGTGVQSANRENTRRDNREEQQEERIKRGEQSGKLTAQEAASLRKGQERVRALENKAEYDGKVTPQERAAIEKAQDEESKRINAQLNDRQRNAATGGTRK
jgi:uncharacterized membrane protein YebE (DUF533 family)